MTSDNRLKTISSNFFRLSEKTSFSGGCAHPFWKIFLLSFLILVIYLDRRSEGGGRQFLDISILIFFFNLSFFYLSVFLSIFLYSYIYRGGGRRSLDIWLYISNYIRYLNIYLSIDLFFLSIFFLSIYLSIFLFLFIYLHKRSKSNCDKKRGKKHTTKNNL